MTKNKSKILFIDPILSVFGRNTPGIACIRGYLLSKNIKSETVNINDDIDNNLKEAYIEAIRSFLLKNGVKKEKIDSIAPPANIQRMHYLLYGLGKEKICEAVQTINVFDKIFNNLLKKFPNIDHLCFSVTFISQLLFSLIAANYFKNNLGDKIKIVLGGATTTENYKDIIKILNQVNIVDYLVLGEGETAMYNIVIDEKKDKIPNLIYKQGNKYYFSSNLKYSESFSKMPKPIYEPGDTIYLQFRRKCYWNKCAFCAFKQYNYSEQDKKRSARQIIEDLKYNIKRTNNRTDICIFSDECLSPDDLTEFSKILINENKIINKFYSFLRCENRFDLDSLKLAKKAGFVDLNIGPETLNSRLLRLINKGYTREGIYKFIKNCADLDIRLTLHFIINFPTQTESELFDELDDINNILVQNDNVKNIYIRKLIIYKGSPFYEFPQDYNIKLIPEKEILFNRSVGYTQQDKQAMSYKEAKKIIIDYYNKNLIKFKDRVNYYLP